MAEVRDTEQSIELVVLENFVTQLLKGMVESVQCHQPTSLNEAMQLLKVLVFFTRSLFPLLLSPGSTFLEARCWGPEIGTPAPVIPPLPL